MSIELHSEADGFIRLTLCFELRKQQEEEEKQEMFGECHAHIIMDGVNYRHAVDMHKIDRTTRS